LIAFEENMGFSIGIFNSPFSPR
jgi:hypothetical protein